MLLINSALGYEVHLNIDGDVVGNYSLFALSDNSQSLVPVGNFQLKQLILTDNIDWPDGTVPLAIPVCGFQDEYCLQHYAACEIVMGIIGGLGVVISVVLIIAYRSYKYEQELDSLLWKINPDDLVVLHQEAETSASKVTKFYLVDKTLCLCCNQKGVAEQCR